MEELIFIGFPESGLRFLSGLKKNNNKAWFDKRKEIYEQDVLQPLKALVWEIGLKLSRDVAPNLVFEPKVNRTIFRIYRDTRFSNDKSPYKTNVAAFLWEGNRGRNSSPGFYVHIEDDAVYVGAGIYLFDAQGLELFRKAVLDRRMGGKLDKILADRKLKPFLPVMGEQLKRVPSGYPADHPRADFLRYKGLYLGTSRDPGTVHTRRFLNSTVNTMRKLGDLHGWLREVLG